MSHDYWSRVEGCNLRTMLLPAPVSLASFARRTLGLTLVVLALAACANATDPAVSDTTSTPALPVAARLPVLRVTTNGNQPITSREVYLAGSYTLTDTTAEKLAEGPLEIRGRGHSTSDLMPKKPYRVRLTTSTALMGMPASRHWVLLANYSDKTLLRNDVAFEFSRVLGMEWTPRSRFVDLELNGSYQGIYQLVEHVRIAPDRVNIPEMKVADTSATNITGGYLIEVDERRGEDFCFNSTMTPMIFCLSNPETLNDPAWAKQRAYITSYIARIDSVLFSPQFADPQTGYAAYIDVESAISYYILNEYFKNVDGNLRLSTFLYKKRGGKLTFGPVWDFDLAMGNVNYDNADKIEGWHIRTAPWFSIMFQDPVFAARVKTRWNQMVADNTLNKLGDYITERTAFMHTVQTRNFERWPILNIWVWPNRVVTGSYDGEINAMRNWLFARRVWMSDQLR
jgi:CotH protein